MVEPTTLIMLTGLLSMTYSIGTSIRDHRHIHYFGLTCIIFAALCNALQLFSLIDLDLIIGFMFGYIGTAVAIAITFGLLNRAIRHLIYQIQQKFS